MEPEAYRQTAEAEAAHFWFRELRRVWSRLLDRATAGRRGLRVLDAGCGTGGNLRALEGLHEAIGLDLSGAALRIAREMTRSPLARASVGALPFRAESFDAILCTDVLYHLAVEDDVATLVELRRVLKPGGALVLNLPAFESLRSAHDVAVHTARRYTRGTLRRRLVASGLVPERILYWNGLLLPPIALLRLARRGGRGSDIRTPPGPVNALLAAVGAIDAGIALAGLLPAGLSVAAIARRPA